MWRTDILTYLPDLYPGILGHSLLGKALENKIWSLNVHDLANFSNNKHRNIDDRPAGGGAGMVLQPDVVARAIDKCHENDIRKRPLVYLSPAGERFDQKMAREWAHSDGIVFLCGRFEGVDQRVLDARHIKEVSLGDFILCGGDVAAMAMIESTVRLLSGTVGDQTSLAHESFENVLLEHPQYTKPREWEGHKIPDVLLSGHHKAIADWRHEQAILRTKARRPDLWNEYCCLNKKD